MTWWTYPKNQLDIMNLSYKPTWHHELILISTSIQIMTWRESIWRDVCHVCTNIIKKNLYIFPIIFVKFSVLHVSYLGHTPILQTYIYFYAWCFLLSLWPIQTLIRMLGHSWTIRIACMSTSSSTTKMKYFPMPLDLLHTWLDF